ncbi:MAG: hypothetical protein KGJ58_02790 [Patescibacteria group bacterium]|nr:hypothetical protein [Patescibacteria group bacterium]MDE1988578.1 hypothetical protein [Patescibacteria group bacterium]MDE2218351.1 hypothetical protein [Patescibacteria group bacterium]
MQGNFWVCPRESASAAEAQSAESGRTLQFKAGTRSARAKWVRAKSNISPPEDFFIGLTRVLKDWLGCTLRSRGDMNPKIEQWKRDIEKITSDVTDTIESQFIFKRLGEIVTANSKIGADNLFWDHLASSFGASLVLGITRQVDKRPEVVSLLKLLEDIKDNPGIITKQWYGDEYEKSPVLGRAFGIQSFEEHFGSKPELDPDLIEKDIQALKSATAKVARFRHTRIAHKNADERLVIDLNFAEVEAALKEVERLVIRYQLLLNQSDYNELMPSITYNWESIFRTPWIDG